MFLQTTFNTLLLYWNTKEHNSEPASIPARALGELRGPSRRFL
jgi:hypothetical protein